MYPQGTTAALNQHLEIATSLGRFNDAKRIFLLRYGKILRIIACNLQKDARVRSTFVCLTGGMQKAWAKAQAGCIVLAIPHGMTNVLQPRLVIGVHFDVGEQAEVIAIS